MLKITQFDRNKILFFNKMLLKDLLPEKPGISWHGVQWILKNFEDTEQVEEKIRSGTKIYFTTD